MKGIAYKAVLTCLLGLIGTNAFAQSFTVNPPNQSGQFGDTVSISVDYAAGADIGGVAMDINYTDAQFDVQNLMFDDLANDATLPINNCSDDGMGSISCTFAGGMNMSAGSITFDLLIANPGTVATETIDLVCNSVSDTGGTSIGCGAVTFTDGTVDVTAGPVPEYDSAPAADADGAVDGTAEISFGDVEGSGTITSDLVISNIGQVGSSLTGMCTIANNDAAISISNGDFSGGIADGGSQTVTVNCDTTTRGTYTGEVTCTSNDSDEMSNLYEVSCAVTSPGAGVLTGNPASPGPVDIGDVLVGGGAGSADLILSNTGGPDPITFNGACTLTNTGAITIGVANAPADTDTIAAGASTTVTFSCPDAAPGMGTGTFDCTYDDDLSMATPDLMQSWNVQCNVRNAESMAGFPADGTPINITIPGAGTSGSANITFQELNNEGQDASFTCAFSGTDAAAFTATPMMGTIPAGGSVVVTIDGTDPNPFTDASLDCTLTDSSGDTLVSYPLGFIIQPAIVPTLSQWGLILMVLALMGFGVYSVRRQSIH